MTSAPDPRDRDPAILEVEQRARVLLGLARGMDASKASLDRMLCQITEAAARTLPVERASIWRYTPGRTEIECYDLYEASADRHTSGTVLAGRSFPAYFRALADARVIAAGDAHTDPRTGEFSASYLTPLGIGAMLDAPIWLHGEMVGVVCQEHVGGPRAWSASDQAFAGSIADLASRAMEANERYLAEQQARALEQHMLLTQKLEGLGLLAGGVAHDFNNLLSVIMGNAGLALRRLAAHPAAPQIERIKEAAAQAAALTKQLLDYAGQGRSALRPTGLNELVRESARLLEVTVPDHATLVLDLADGLTSVAADGAQLRQVVLNLVQNAVDALEGEAGTVTVRTRPVVLEEPLVEVSQPMHELPAGLAVRLEVVDSGRGMDAETRARVLDPFFTTKAEGRGLGLAVVAGIVRGHGGVLSIETAPGKGTRVQVTLPVGVPSGTVQVPRIPAQIEGPAEGTAVLVAEDKPMVLEITKLFLEDFGFRVETALTGREAVEAVRSAAAPFAAAVLDVSMPELDGVEALNQIRELRPGMPGVLVSGFAEGDVTERVKGGRVAFVQKPYTPEMLLAAILGVIAEQTVSAR